MNVCILTIGDEILIGQIVDTNSAWMGQQLNLAGAHVVRVISVGDTPAAIVDGLRQALAVADVVLITGGLGPTKDDITKKALADFFEVELVFHQPTFERIERIFQNFGRQITDAHRLQAFMPANATILPNKMGTAPGMWMEFGEKVLVSMPGVPFEMQYLMEHEVLPRLKVRFPGKPIAHRTILTVGEGESILAQRLEAFEVALPENIKLAYLPNLGQVRLRLTGTSDDEAALNQLLDAKAVELTSIIPDIVFGTGNEQLEGVIGQMLKARGLKLATAESCTGGYLAHLITSIPGSSEYFAGGVVAYANEAKENLLKVQSETLARHGAVSEATVTEMVKGALGMLKTDIAVATSGIAGPGGGTPDKPVGTIWMAVGDRNRTKALKFVFGKDRLKNIEFSSVYALNLIRKFLQEHYPV